MEMSNLQDLMVENLKDLYSAETQMLKAMPRVAKKIQNQQLRSAFEMHMRETEGQIERLEQIFEQLGEKPTGKKCKGMEGLIAENQELLSEDAEQDVLEAGLIVGAQKVEHYEIAGYGSAVTFAKLLGNQEAARLLAQSLDEEERTDKKLTQIAESTINVQAAEGGGEDDDEGASTMSAGRSSGRSSGRSNGGSRGNGGGGGGSRGGAKKSSSSRRSR